YYTRTTVNQRHSHLMGGSTSVASGGNDSHVHYYKGTTSFDDGHVHYFRGTTGPAIPLPGGGHVHELMGQTSYADGHLHYYRGRTGGGISAM
ncbi:YmaF family protein, partial [Frankia sp. Cpl3]|nr:YmaF family protein [Frankia sp. Cpl3]